jgi:hypothetical protein
VFPGFRCEFSGTESQREAALRFDRMLDTADLRRPPSSFLKMRYDNPRTRGGSVGQQRGITDLDVLTRELRELAGSKGAFIEVENFRSQVRRIEWDGAVVLIWGKQRRELTINEALRWAESLSTTVRRTDGAYVAGLLMAAGSWSVQQAQALSELAQSLTCIGADDLREMALVDKPEIGG